MKKLLRTAMMLCAAFAVSGCRVAPQQRAILTQYEHDLRRYEDLIYELEYEYEIVCSENERLKEKLAVGEDGTAQPSHESPRVFRPRTDSPGGKKPSVKKETVPDDDLTPPVIEAGPSTPMNPKPLPPEVSRTPLKDSSIPPASSEIPSLSNPSNNLPDKVAPKTIRPNTNSSNPLIPKPTTVDEPPPSTLNSPILPSGIRSNLLPPREKPATPAPQEILPAPRNNKPTSAPRLPELLPDPADKTVSQLLIDSRQTHGVNLDRTTGDDGLHIVLQPVNAEGQMVLAPGKVTVVLLDPNKQGEAARVGKWEFDADFVRYQLHTAKRRHIALDIPWAEIRPDSSQLSLFVRYESPEGRSIDANEQVQIHLPGDPTIQTAWTPRAPHRRGPLAKVPAAVVAIPAAPKPIEPMESIVPVAHLEEEPAAAKTAEQPTARPEWKPYR